MTPFDLDFLKEVHLRAVQRLRRLDWPGQDNCSALWRPIHQHCSQHPYNNLAAPTLTFLVLSRSRSCTIFSTPRTRLTQTPRLSRLLSPLLRHSSISSPTSQLARPRWLFFLSFLFLLFLLFYYFIIFGWEPFAIQSRLGCAEYCEWNVARDVCALEHGGMWYTGCEFITGSTPIWNYILSLLPETIAKL